MSISDVISYLISPSLQEKLLPIRIMFIFFGVVFLGGTIWFFFYTTWFKKIFWQDFMEILRYKPYWIKKTAGKWHKIAERLKKGQENEYKLAFIEADEMLDNSLEKMGYQGASLGQRLEQIKVETISNIEDVWKAHKIKNNIVHDPNYKLTLDQAKKALNIYQKALHELGVF